MKTKQEIALHLINEDIKYHRMIRHLAEMDVHIEFYPDLASAVQNLIAPDLSEAEEQEWTDRYAALISQTQVPSADSAESFIRVLV